MKKLFCTLLLCLLSSVAGAATNNYNIGDQTNISGGTFTNSTLSGTTTLPALNASSLVVTSAGRALGSYAGSTPCSSQAMYSLSAAGAAACTSTFAGGGHTGMTALGIRSTGSGAYDLTLANTENLTAGRTLTLKLNNAARTIDLAGNLTLAGALSTSGAYGLTFTLSGATGVTLPTSGTLVGSADSGTVTNTMLAGSIANNKLLNSTISGVALGANLSTLTIGTGLSGTSYNGSAGVTIAIDSTVATLTGAQSLTNKKLGSLTSNGLVTTSGADGTLSVTVPGTGVLSALSTAVGSAGAPVLFNGALGTPSSGVATNLTGTAAGLTAGSVTTNANLTGPITSTGNATAVAAQTGTGSTFVMQNSPALTTPNIGVASATSLTLPSAGNTALNWFEQGVFTPTVSGLAVVLGGGTVTYVGEFTRLGNTVFFTIRVVTTGAATTASTVGVTYFDSLPYAPAAYVHVVSAASEDGTSVSSNGIIYVNGRVYPPSWPAFNGRVSIAGFYTM